MVMIMAINTVPQLRYNGGPRLDEIRVAVRVLTITQEIEQPA
jgi:hypothetical protein